jgi:hypothetical protein
MRTVSIVCFTKINFGGLHVITTHGVFQVKAVRDCYDAIDSLGDPIVIRVAVAKQQVPQTYCVGLLRNEGAQSLSLSLSGLINLDRGIATHFNQCF